jgi:uncharacterized protein (DUF849 family)
MVPYQKDNPAVPILPEQITEDVRRCFAAGARTFHIHAREPHETPSFRRELLVDMMKMLRAREPGAVICLTTSGRLHKTFAERSSALFLDDEFKPDLASLTLGSMNFPKHASVNEPQMIQRLATCMQERGIVPEIEIFDFGMLDYAHYLIQKGILKPPFVFNLILGSLGMLAAAGLNLTLLLERLPQGAFWSVGGIGRFQFKMNVLGVALGGHVRTGLEDNLYLDTAKSKPATNELLVRRIVDVAGSIGRSIASPAETRRMMGLGNE